MLNRLRIHMTALYLLSALVLIGIVSGGAYAVLANYFHTTVDLALRHKMAHEFQQLQIAVPPELVAADLIWYSNRQQIVPNQPAPTPSDPRAQATASAQAAGDVVTDTAFEDLYDGELTAIVVLSLNAEGQLATGSSIDSPPLAPDATAVAAARAHGSDIRSVVLSTGVHFRILTYRVPQPQGPVFLQLARTLSDQDRALAQFLLGLLAVGGMSVVLIGVGSWWLAGRSVRPAQQAWKQQQTFVANASHELRTPLAVMRASAEVLMRGLAANNRNQRTLLGDLIDECDHMSRLVSNLLTLSRLDAGQLALDRVSIAVNTLLVDVQRQASPLAQTLDIALTVKSEPCRAWGDPVQLRQVILILLDNALQHTPAGGTIHLEVVAQLQSVQIVVADTGSGIAPEHLPHVFERFYRSEDSRSSAYQGAGLGLAIAHALIEAQHGQIAIESREHAGTRVHVTLPLVTAEHDSTSR